MGWTPNDSTNGIPRLTIRQASSFRVLDTPRPYDGTVSAPAAIETDVSMKVYDLDGGRLSDAITTNLAGPPDPSAFFIAIVIDKNEGLVEEATPAHYAVDTVNPDPFVGREMVGLIPRSPTCRRSWSTTYTTP